MALILRHSLPFFFVRGEDNTLTFDVYSAASAQQTATVGTVQILDGAEEVVAAGTAMTSLGPPASYSLLSATLGATRAFSAGIMVYPTLTISGTAIRFKRRGYIVRHAYFPSITDVDLTDQHTELAAFLSGASSTALDISSYEKYRERANVMIQNRLLSLGRRPWLLFEPSTLVEPHIALTLHLIYKDFASTIGQGEYAEMRDYYWDPVEETGVYESAWKNAAAGFTYDANESGALDASEEEAVPSTPILVTTAGNAYRSGYSF